MIVCNSDVIPYVCRSRRWVVAIGEYDNIFRRLEVRLEFVIIFVIWIVNFDKYPNIL